MPKPLTAVGTKTWKQRVPPHLAVPLQNALDAVEQGQVSEALRWFGICAEKCEGPGDPNLRPILYFGAQAAASQYFSLRGAGQDIPASYLAQWRYCAETLITAAWEIAPGDPVAAHNAGRFLHDCDEWEAAMAMYRIALQLKPDQVESWGNLGTAYANMGDRDAAARCWMKCTAFEPENPSGALAQAYVYLRKGDYPKGWASWEHRWQDMEFAKGYGRKELMGKRWTGEPLTKRHTLYVHGEQGLGDHLMFSRYVPLLQERGYHIIGLETRPTLMRWMAECFPDIEIVSRATVDASGAPPHTHHVSTMSLPHIFGSTIETIPAAVAPLAVPSREVEWSWASAGHIGPFEPARKRVAIAWCGAAGNPADNVRSIPAHELARLADCDVEWVSVQFTPDAGMIARSWLGDVEDATDTCKDVLDTAKVLAGCDLVVTVDTLTAHLAGSLGVPSIVLHRFDREWRWYEATPEQSVWYPNQRQWTQPAPGDWASLLTRVREELAA